MSNDAEIKKIRDQIQGLMVEKTKLKKPCPHTGQAARDLRQERIEEIDQEIVVLTDQLAEAIGKPVAGAIWKG